MVTFLMESPSDTNPYFSILSNCMLMMTFFVEVRIAHIYREANTWADTLAKHGDALATPFIIFDFPTSFASHLLANDACGAKNCKTYS